MLLNENDVETCALLSKTSKAKSEIRGAVVPASAKHESGTSSDLLERIQNAKDYIPLKLDMEDYYKIKDGKKL